LETLGLLIIIMPLIQRCAYSAQRMGLGNAYEIKKGHMTKIEPAEVKPKCRNT
jgi:hypothetical protein